MKKYFLIVVLLWSFTGCKKEIEIASPVVTYQYPAENTVFEVLDTIRVNADVTAAEEIGSFEVCLTNENLDPVLPSVSHLLLTGKSTLHIDLLYPIDDIRLESGNYFVLISVKTAHSSKNKYQKIILHEYPRVLQGVLLIQKANVNTTRLSLFTPDLIMKPLFLFPIDYGYSEIKSYDRTFYLGGKHVGDFYAFDLDSLVTRFNYCGYSGVNPAWVQGIGAEEGGVRLSTADGLLTTYELSGKMKSSIKQVYPLYPTVSFVYNNYLLVNVLTLSGPESYLKSYYYPWGGSYQTKQLNFTILKMFSPRAGEVLMFGNTSGQAVLNVYYPETQTLWAPLNNVPGKIIDVCQADSKNYLIATTTGVYWYQYQTQTLTLFASVTGTVGLCFEDLSKRLLIATSQDLKICSFPESQLVTTITLTDSLEAISLLYNK
ncbi:MAG: hypothetical protein WCO63_08950 [Bacteroidota bacterium]